MQDFEKLGAFYLGRLKTDNAEEKPLLLYDAKDLTTHAMCVGMTGSGKTGLCVGLLEEAAIDGIPALIIDPKGDIGNLLLTFPQLRAQDFEPWVDEGEATRKGMSVPDFAASTADTWKKGIAGWGQGPERIKRLRAAADFAIYTPGSTAGLPISLLRSFSAPPEGQRKDLDGMRERIMSTVSGLLALLGVDADPIQSREHILLSNIFNHAWSEGRDMEIADVIRAILAPPFTQLGVFDLETFYPEKDRRALAMQLNNVLASPSFASWMEGEPLDIGKLLYQADGKPRVSILSIAHLSEQERMFFVTLVLNEMVAWIRRQSGTSSLRAILYMDEIFGYFPPTANPPSKTPMLTLLKQARAFGLGCVLATQNPVDLDYKGLGNTGTWFIGRLQTERDKLRVLDGLEGASTAAGKAFDRETLDATISGLGKRVFLMNNVHDDAPVLFETRWVLSYLRGPLTRMQIETLMSARKQQGAGLTAAADPSTPAAASARLSKKEQKAAAGQEKPVVTAAAPETWLDATRPLPAGTRLLYRPGLLTSTSLHYANARAKIDDWSTLTVLAPVPERATTSPWDDADVFPEENAPGERGDAEQGAGHADLPAAAANQKNITLWNKKLKTWLYQNRSITAWSCRELKLLSEPGETEGEFRVRLTQALHEKRDLDMEKLRTKYLPKFSRVQDKIRRAEERIDREEAQYKNQTLNTAVSIGSTLLGALLGRRSSTRGTINRAASSVNRASRAMREKDDIKRAKAGLQAAQQELVALEDRFREDAEKMKNVDVADLKVSEIVIRPRKSDITVGELSIAWVPWSVSEDGIAERLL